MPEEFGGPVPQAGPADAEIAPDLLAALAEEQARMPPVPPDFGGADGRISFAKFLADAMLAAGSLREIPTWQPPGRLPLLRGRGVRGALERLCVAFLKVDLDAVSACSTDTAGEVPVNDILRFLEHAGIRNADFPGDETAPGGPSPPIHAVPYRIGEVPVLALAFDGIHGRRLAVLGPLFVEPSPDIGQADAGDPGLPETPRASLRSVRRRAGPPQPQEAFGGLEPGNEAHGTESKGNANPTAKPKTRPKRKQDGQSRSRRRKNTKGDAE